MKKGLFTIIMLFLLALQPAGMAYAVDGNPHFQVWPDNSTVFEIACEQTSSNECADANQCLLSGHVGCHLNLFQPAAVDGFAWHNKAAYLSSYGVPKLPLYETFPPLRPPKRS
ncbi:MAG: hypothetical protein KJN95_09250 [Gammaproteobacteria bacterium]|nr:hypothetical protein [Gammaproteobacteria bacterium]